MARIRSVKPEYPQNRKVRAVSRDARLLNILLWNIADDEGRLQELPQWILGQVFPTDEDVTPAVLKGWLEELERARLIIRYEVDGERYIGIENWCEHQHPEKPKPSNLPPPPEPGIHLVPDESGTSPGGVGDESPLGEEEERDKERNGNNSSSSAPASTGSYPEILSALDAVAFARQRPSPKVPAVETACAEYAHLDLKAEAAKFAHYFTEGPGAERKLDDIAWKWRQWLGNVKGGGSGGSKKARDSVAADLAKLEKAHRQAVAEESAA